MLIIPVHRGPKLNNILPRLADMKYLPLIDVSSGYHNLKLDGKSSVFLSIWQALIHTTTIWTSPSRRYAPEENRWIIQQHAKCIWFCWWHFHCRFWWTGKDHDEMLEKLLWVHKQVNLKLDKEKCLHVYQRPLHGWDNFMAICNPRPKKGSSTYRHSTTKDMGLLSFLVILNYLSEFSPRTAEMWATAKTDISKDRLNMEQNIPRSL